MRRVQSGPDVPSLIATLGIPETVGRLNSALEFWNGQKPGQREQDKDGHLTGM